MLSVAKHPEFESVLKGSRILIADDDSTILSVVSHYLSSWGAETITACCAEEVYDILEKEEPELLFLDLQFGDANGLEVLQKLVGNGLQCPVVMFSGYGSIDVAVQAMKLGAFEFIEKPVEPAHLHRIAKHGIDECQFRKERGEKTHRNFNGVLPVCRSPQLRDVLEKIEAVTATDARVLITGESGTGKELVARGIHNQSHRSAGPFVPVNMAALPESLAESVLFGHEKGAFTGASAPKKGLCESANGGTLFLDEIGETDIRLQPKLLRFLQEGIILSVGSTEMRACDARIIAATNRDCEQMIKEGTFREDLFYRLHVVEIKIPPLRERIEDIAPLANLFITNACERYEFVQKELSRESLEALLTYPWPGNVRQLEHMMHHAVLMTKNNIIEIEDLPENVRSGSSPTMVTPSPDFEVEIAPPTTIVGLSRMERIERDAIQDAIKESEGKVVSAAQRLGIGQATLYRKMKKYDLPLPRFGNKQHRE